jgi:hypothetical protein
MPLLSVANRAAREPLGLVLLHKLSPKRDLIRRWLPIHVEDLLPRPNKLFRIAVTLQTPLHVESILAPHERHLIHAAVASGAAHALVNMNAVIEIDEARQVVHPRPLQRLPGPETLAHRLQNRALGPDLGVATHADLSGWNAGERGLFHRGVAVTAIDAGVTNVVFMAELHRLAARDTNLRHIGRSVNRRERGYEDDDDGSAPEYAHPGDSVRAAMKNLRHARMSFELVGR